MLKRTCSCLVLLAAVVAARAEVQLPALFSDNMVLQQGRPVTIWGWAQEGEKVTVKFRGQTVSTTTHNLKWSVKLRALKAGGPDLLTLGTPQNTVILTNVLVGEVWVCSGQSNMEWPLSASFQPGDDIAGATNQFIRLFHVQKAKSDSPTVKLKKVSWQLCSPEVARSFSAVGYYFGRDLQAARKVPVGLIESDWGS